MTELSADARLMQARLQRRYLDSIPAKRAAIEAGWRRVQADDWDPAAVAALRELAHRLAGSAGGYGLDAVGAAARRFDAVLQASSGDADRRRRADREALALLQSLQDVMDKKT